MEWLIVALVREQLKDEALPRGPWGVRKDAGCRQRAMAVAASAILDLVSNQRGLAIVASMASRMAFWNGAAAALIRAYAWSVWQWPNAAWPGWQ